MSTFTYLAYANEPSGLRRADRAGDHRDTRRSSPKRTSISTSSQEFGLSTYDHHSDGAGCCYSSWRRPIINLRPRYRDSAIGVTWALPADLSLIWWLERAGYDYEVLTDHDLARRGRRRRSALPHGHQLYPPRVLFRAMLDATEDYLCGGGRLIYAGGNGYYWVSGLRDGEPHCMEVRKLDAGSRAWQADPGEAISPAPVSARGLWRSRGRAPQKIVGIGFTSEGMDESQPFERMPDSFHKRVAWMFEGHRPAGADRRFRTRPGTAPRASRSTAMISRSARRRMRCCSPRRTAIPTIIRWSRRKSPMPFPARGGTQDPQVRADITYFTTPNDGACLSIGSIAWSQALPVNEGNNNVGTFMRNVLNAFLRPGRLPGSEFVGEEKLWR